MTNKTYWHDFLNNLNALENTTEIEQFFEMVLTPSEREKIAARYQILAELVENKRTQRDIAATLGVSIFNVTRGANQLKIIDSKIKALIGKK